MMLSQLIKSVIVTKFIALVFLAAGPSGALAADIPYYGEDFYRELKIGTRDLDMQLLLREIMQKAHVPRRNQPDLIQDQCDEAQDCYVHRAVGYRTAREWIMTDYYVRVTSEGRRIRDVYCDLERPTGKGIPNNQSINVEHTWPQSRFNKKFPKDLQKSDLHHLFPTHSRVNMIRGSNPFGEVTHDEQELDCEGPRFGMGSAGTADVFQPPKNHQGNVARALFYFSVRYDLKISSNEERILRKWHYEDPVDSDEMQRNDEIFELQGNRNPFIDFPELVDRISDF